MKSKTDPIPHMANRNRTELILAVVVSLMILTGMTLIGLRRFPNKSNATLAPYPFGSAGVAPIFPTQDCQDAVRPEAEDVSATASPSPCDAVDSNPEEGAKEIGHAGSLVQLDAGTSAIASSGTATQVASMPTASVATTLAVAPLAHPNAKTPTPVRVVVSTQQRSWVYFHGPATYVRADVFSPLPLSGLPRPVKDNGRGLDWFPTTYQTQTVVDRFVPELAAMNVRWVVILQGMNDWDLIANDYMIDRLNSEGIQVVMRIDRQVGKTDWQRLGWIVARYRERGVRYFQLFNEPNVDDEWGTDAPHSPQQFVSYWIQGAEVIAANGGLPGFSPMSPQPDDSDLAFFQAALEELKRQGRYDLINQMWIAVHNYGDFDPSHRSSDGFFRYRAYDAIVKQVFGASLPIIITEGGTGDAEQMADVIAPMYQFVAKEREPYVLAFAPWLIGNAVGGGHDPRWEAAAWFTGALDQVQPRRVVEEAKRQ